MLGKTLGHYAITGKLGSGGMGDVYRAVDARLDRELALKVLPPHFAQDADRRNRFNREARAVARLKHPNIVTLHSVEEVDGIHFLTMEFVEGSTLAARIPREGLDAARFFEYAIPLADAVSYAHEEGITHRDLKPANVMFDRGNRLKVLDFGLAKMLVDGEPNAQAATLAESNPTAEGKVLGTAAYMSPEQAEGKPVDHRSDIFSLGIVLYEMATGMRPFQGDTQVSTLTAILRDAPPPISELRHELPRHLGRIIHRCLEKDPERRYQTAKDVRNELEGLKREIDSGYTPLSQPSTTAVSTAHSRSWLPWALAAALVLVIAGGLWAFRPRGVAVASQPPAEPATPAASASSPAATAPADRRKMMVVLPFESLGPPEESYFAAGMTEEITSRLATISGLGVISRTSATQYDRAGKTMRQIAEDLGVDFVVEGTVRWARAADGKDQVRITPKLIRVADDTQVWSESFDRRIDDIFEVQTEIASQVINRLGVTLLGAERDQLAKAPTDDVEAYALYLQAKNLRMDDWFEADRRRVELLEQAVALDPDFLEAWTMLSSHHSGFYMDLERTDARLAKSRAALQRAEGIDPDHPQTHLARGNYLYRCLRAYDQALEEYETASRLAPNDALAMESVAYIYRRQGKWDQHLERLEAAFRLDPQSANIAYNLAESNRALRRFETAVPFYERAERLNPHGYRARFKRAMTLLAWKGDIPAAREILRDQPEEDVFWWRFGRMVVHLFAREFPEALEQTRLLDNGTPTLHRWSTVLQADLVKRWGLVVPKAPSLEEAAGLLERQLEKEPGDDGLRAALARILALRGESEAAVREARLAADIAAKDAFAGPARLEGLADVYVLTGRHDEAIELLARLLKTVYEGAITPAQLRLDPNWDPLRDDPRFEELLSSGP